MLTREEKTLRILEAMLHGVASSPAVIDLGMNHRQIVTLAKQIANEV